MLTIEGKHQPFCDQLPRRDFLRIGGLALGGLSLPQLLRAESQSPARSHRAVIMVFLGGGPPHQDMFDLKPAAPAQYRGPFHPIATNVPGMEITELLPRLAERGDKLTILRSLCHERAEHSGGTHRFLTGYASRQANLQVTRASTPSRSP